LVRMAKTNMLPTIGAWAFVIGLVLAIIAGFVTAGVDSNIALGLGVLGLIVGLLNVTDKEVMLYLLASITFLVAAGSLSTVLSAILGQLGLVLGYIQVFVGPGAAIVALKAFYDIAKSR